ncbi:hypothetical protein [Pelagibius sp. 7325]|uniref:hypothetical protein n=1 Tax=Pelagibius sp. 7325 TaxID=3131994 RepID=UPI0030EE6124
MPSQTQASRTQASQAELDRNAYEAPADVLADTTLSDAQKRRILESWERDARELAVAEDENMGGGEPNDLDRVLQALAELPAPPERPRGPATMHGSQPTPTAARSASPSASAPLSAGSSSSPAAETGGPTLSGGEARQGEIILKTRTRQAIFIAGLVAAAVIGVLGFYIAWPVGS